MTKIFTKSVLGQLCGLAALLVIVACEPIKPEHCPYADWAATGELHAAKGYQSRLPGLVDTCMKVGVLPDADAYLAGYRQGLLSFCTIENGWVWGEHHNLNPWICPPSMAEGFDRGFAVRAKLEELVIEEQNLRQARDSIEERLAEGEPVTYEEIYEMRQMTEKLERLDTERERTRNGFANWLNAMGLVAPHDLYKY